jgi:small subunit ribosomal protein S13
MPRIIGTDIPENKKVRIALRYIYGVGPKIASDILVQTKINGDKRASDLTSDEINKIQIALEKHLTEGDLKRAINDNIDRLRRIKSYRGLRHMMALSCRGQRTRSNCRTVRGRKRQTVGSMTKEMATKLDQAKIKKN